MIPRYTRPQMAAIWADENRFRIWLEIECLALEALAKRGEAPPAAAKAARRKGRFEIARIAELERGLGHDVLAFLTNVAEHIGPPARFMHRGLTSSDILDTAFNLQLTQAGNLLLEDLDALLPVLEARALEHRHTLCVGRSHGIHAEPTSFGLKFLQAYAEFARNRRRLEAACREVGTCALSGTVGTFASVHPSVEAHVARALGLRPEPVSTQIIPRDRHAMFFATLAVIASSIERLAVELRHLQRTELRESEEPFGPEQKGSSAMPHKRNPVLSENLTGLARIVRGMAIPALENVALWHERDISHSSAERMIGPDATAVLDFALVRLAGLVKGLAVSPERMRENLDLTGGLIYSHSVLLALTDAGLAREKAYRLVQRAAARAHEGKGAFAALLRETPEIAAALPGKALDKLFDPRHHLRRVDQIFTRVLGRKRASRSRRVRRGP